MNKITATAEQITEGSRVRDVNPDRLADRDSFGCGTVKAIEIEDESTGVPTYSVRWDVSGGVDVHGPMDVELISA